MEDVVGMQFGCDVKKVAQHRVDIVILSHHRRILIEHLTDSDVVAHLHGDGIDAVVALIGGIMELLFLMDISQCLVLSFYAATEGNGISHLIVELHKIGILAVNKAFIEITIRQPDLSSLTHVTRLKQFLEIHLFADNYLISFTILMQKYI